MKENTMFTNSVILYRLPRPDIQQSPQRARITRYNHYQEHYMLESAESQVDVLKPLKLQIDMHRLCDFIKS